MQKSNNSYTSKTISVCQHAVSYETRQYKLSIVIHRQSSSQAISKDQQTLGAADYSSPMRDGVTQRVMTGDMTII